MNDSETKKWLYRSIIAYVLIMTCVYPLWMQNGYSDLDYAKFSFFRLASVVFIVITVLASVYINYFKERKGFSIIEQIKSFSVTDGFVLAYLCVSVLSSLLSEYRTDTWWGTPGWYMGLLSQLLFCGVYFCISRFFRYSPKMLYPILTTAFIVFIIALMQCMGLDPFNLYKGMDNLQKSEFLSTIGQKTWFSSYVVQVFPFIVYLYLKEEKRILCVIWAVLSVLISCVICSTQSDSTYIGVGLGLLVLLRYSLEDKTRILRLIEIGMLMFISFGVMGMIYRSREVSITDMMFEEEPFTMFLTDIKISGSILAVFLIVYFLIKTEKEGSFIDKYKNRIWIGFLLMAAVPTMIFAICSLSVFNDEWGNHRGFIWKIAFQTYTQENMKEWFIGVGPDMFDLATQKNYHNEIHRMWGDIHIPNAHNEWLNMLLTQGLLGLVAYIGIFVSAINAGIKKAKSIPMIYPIVAAVIAYMGHNFFCYQQCIGTSLVFILLGILSYSVAN